MRSKLMVVLLALLAAVAVGWLVLGTEGIHRLLGLGRANDTELDGEGVDAGGERGEDAAKKDSARRGPELLGSRRLLRVGKGGLKGRVLDVSTTKPVAKAVVTITGTGLAKEPVAAKAETAEDGTFRIGDVAAGLDYVVRVAAPCRLLDDALGPGAARALHDRGGTVLRLLGGGTIRVGDDVRW